MKKSSHRFRNTLITTTARSVLALGRWIPLPGLRRIGRGVSAATAPFVRRERRRARENLRRAFAAEPDRWRRRIERDLSRHLGDLLGEAAWLWYAPPEAISRKTSICGLENLRGAADGRGIVLITGHCGNWEWMNLALAAAGYPLTVAAREIFEPRLDTMVRRLRGRFGGETVVRGDRAGQRLVGAMRRGAVAGLLIDQDIDAPGAFVEFFGQPAWTPTGAATLAVRLDVPVVTGFCTRHAGGNFEIRISPPWPIPRTLCREEAAAQLTADLTAAIEEQIRLAPAQWPWFHRRWRRQPGPGQQVWTADSAVRRWIQELMPAPAESI